MTERERYPGRPLDRHLARRLAVFFHEEAPGGQDNAVWLLEKLRVWQYRHLLRTVTCARTNALHYRRILAGLSFPETFQPAAAGCDEEMFHLLHGLPFTLPKELAAAPESFLAVGHDEVAGLISLPTSGTTGPGKRIFCTGADLAETVDFFSHGMRFLVGPGRGDHVALLMSGEREGSVGALLKRGMRALGVPCTVLGFPVDEEASLAALLDLRPTCLVGTPAHILSLARHARAPQLARGLSTILLSGDAVTETMRAAIAVGFQRPGGCAVFVHYGLTETGLGGAVECTCRQGCHIREADLLVEIIDGYGQELPPGEWGEIVITTLTREAMPLLRYRTGDLGRILPGHCACGSVLRRLEVHGRLREVIRLPIHGSFSPAGGVLHITTLDQCLYALPWVKQYQATLYTGKEKSLFPPCLLLSIRPASGCPRDALLQVEAALARIPGLYPVHSAREQAAAPPDHLPVMVRIEAGGEVFPCLQAKKSINHVKGSLPWRLYPDDHQAPR